MDHVDISDDTILIFEGVTAIHMLRDEQVDEVTEVMEHVPWIVKLHEYCWFPHNFIASLLRVK